VNSGSHNQRPADGAIERIIQLATIYAEQGGDYLSQASWWNRKKWSRHVLTEWNLPRPISRRDVFDIVDQIRTTSDAERDRVAEKAFVAIMVWGYGTTGYGPHRVKEMRASRQEGLGSYMVNITEAASDGPVEAYRFLANNKAKQLGPSYGSKVAYFATPGEVSPVLDSEVAQWIQQYEGRAHFQLTEWSTLQYGDFQAYCSQLLDVIRPLVSEAEQTLGLVEYLMFTDRFAGSLPSWARRI